jgi:hypothetical protein
MHRLVLTREDNARLSATLDALTKAYETIEDPELIRQAPVLARDVPAHLEEFRIGEPSALCLVSGLVVDESQLGDTPSHWRDSQYDSTAFASTDVAPRVRRLRQPLDERGDRRPAEVAHTHAHGAAVVGQERRARDDERAVRDEELPGHVLVERSGNGCQTQPNPPQDSSS